MSKCCRNGVKADDKLHAVLMSAVGGASLEEATSLRQKLSDKGIMHNQVQSTVCLFWKNHDTIRYNQQSNYSVSQCRTQFSCLHEFYICSLVVLSVQLATNLHWHKQYGQDCLSSKDVYLQSILPYLHLHSSRPCPKSLLITRIAL